MKKFVELLLTGKESEDSISDYEMFWKKHRFTCDNVWDFLGYSKLELDWDRNLNKKTGLVTKFFAYIGKSYKEIVNKKEDWDSDGALEVDKDILNDSIFILRIINTSLLEEGIFMVYPEINLCKNGMIDLEWRHNGKIILLHINQDSIDMYADINNNIYKNEYYNNTDDDFYKIIVFLLKLL